MAKLHMIYGSGEKAEDKTKNDGLTVDQKFRGYFAPRAKAAADRAAAAS